MTELSRRQFMMRVATTGVGLCLEVSLSGCSNHDHGLPFMPNAFVTVMPDSRIIVMIKHTEMGQGTMTGLCTLVAEEMDARWSQVIPENAPANAALYGNTVWKKIGLGNVQGTGGSTSIIDCYHQMREAGATIRAMLVAAAAKKWQLPADTLLTENGMVKEKYGRSKLRYGDLIGIARTLEIPTEVPLKKPEEFKLIGTQLSRKDTGKTDGSAIYTQDVVLNDMLIAAVLHAPHPGAKIKSLDSRDAEQIRGVEAVVKIPTGVAVLADSTWEAFSGKKALKVEWQPPSHQGVSSTELFKQYEQEAQKPGYSALSRGKVDISDARGIHQSYQVPYLAHAAMEPMNCVIRTDGKSAELWYGSQAQTPDQQAVAKVLNISPEDVAINTIYPGGSFGRRNNPVADYVVEATEIAKAYGKPVPIKMVWSREDDMQAEFFRPMYYHKLSAELDGKNIAQWHHKIIGQSAIKNSIFEKLNTPGIDISVIEGATEIPYKIPNLNIDTCLVEGQATGQWWRSVGNSHNAFVIEAFMDELAHKANVDPLEFRLNHLKEDSRHSGVLREVAKISGWHERKAKRRHFYGLAQHSCFGSYVAQVAELERVHKKFRVKRVFCAVDCGIVINPDIVKAQVEGGIGFGLAQALLSENTFDKNGQLEQKNFDKYQVVRMKDMPIDIIVSVLPSAQPPGGVGEIAVPPIAPAVINALYAATGKRINKLPAGPEYF